jgi:hypothetical protein|nr:MAG TPA: hypothetical protein [Caudoviricetes sp.]DAN97994.1 MAG TPA: hypothetical protein [Caudoviricetes sp.]
MGKDKGDKMQRLTEKADLGNWCLKGVRWEFEYV